MIWGSTGVEHAWVRLLHTRDADEKGDALLLKAVTVTATDDSKHPVGMIQDMRAAFVMDNGEDAGIDIVFRLAGEQLLVNVVASDTQPARLLLFATGLETCASDAGELLLPIRMGMLLQADVGDPFTLRLGTYDYEEGVHMAMIGMFKGSAALMATWGDPYMGVRVERTGDKDTRLRVGFELERSARSLSLHCLGAGAVPALARAYRQRAEELGYRVTWKNKLVERPQAAKLFGAANVKLWTALARRIDEDMVEQSVTVRWTFNEAAKIAEHLKHDLQIDDVLFHLGGWTTYGYDCKHPDNMPANPECGGNEGLADCAKRVQDLGYTFCLHDNYQDMYRDAPSWDEKWLQKEADGSPHLGGVWLGGRAYYTCAREAVKLAQRPENLPMVRDIVHPDAYFIDTTYAVGPQECFDPRHPLTKSDDIHWKIVLSDYARDVFGLFGSECGREWAVPHADFFEGLASVSGNYYHQLDIEGLAGRVVPFFDMVFGDGIVIHGKYGYKPETMAEQVIHHVAMGRTLYYHSLGSHLYWLDDPKDELPFPDSGLDAAVFTRAHQGWAEGLCVWDRFIKNTQEVLGPLNKRTSEVLLDTYEFLDKARLIRWTTFGNGITTLVNGSEADYPFSSKLWGEVTLPPYGFFVEADDFVALYARSWNDTKFDSPALFTLTALDNKPVQESRKVRCFHGFGDTTVNLWDTMHTIRREAVLKR